LKRRHRLALVVETSHEVHDCLGKVPLDLPNNKAMPVGNLADVGAVTSAQQLGRTP
jgi:hypothetical protein